MSTLPPAPGAAPGNAPGPAPGDAPDAARAGGPAARLILCADTATEHACVALVRQRDDDTEILGAHTRHEPKGHGPGVLDDLHDLLAAAGCGLGDVTHLVSGLGPGSFTGLRIALATLKGVALATGKPLYGVRTTALLRAQAAVASPGARHYGLIDARRGEVYAEGPGLDRPAVLSPEALAALIREAGAPSVRSRVVLLGSGALAYAERWRALLPEVHILEAPAVHVPQAARMADLVDWSAPPPALATLEPVYVRRSDAELKFPEGIPDATGRRQG